MGLVCGRSDTLTATTQNNLAILLKRKAYDAAVRSNSVSRRPVSPEADAELLHAL